MTQKDIDALTEELMMEAFAQNNEGLSAKIFRNVHYKKFCEQAKERLLDAELNKKITANEQWFKDHDLNITEFEMDFRQLLAKHQIQYFRFGKGYAELSLANNNGRVTLDVSAVTPERFKSDEFAPGYTDAWVGNCLVGSW